MPALAAIVLSLSGLAEAPYHLPGCARPSGFAPLASTIEGLPPCIAKPSAGQLFAATNRLGRLTTSLPPRVIAALDSLSLVADDLDPVILERALVAYFTARRHGFGHRKPFLSIIDYALPASERRLWVFDLAAKRLVFREYVAHGRGTGHEIAERWSNADGSMASSLGLYVTRETYRGRRGYSLRLIGLDPGFNDAAFKRSIVMHGAPYMTDRYRNTSGGYFGQSHGCPALDRAIARQVIDVIRGGSLLFAHYPDSDWLATSAWLQGHRPEGLRARKYVRPEDETAPSPHESAPTACTGTSSTSVALSGRRQ